MTAYKSRAHYGLSIRIFPDLSATTAFPIRSFPLLRQLPTLTRIVSSCSDICELITCKDERDKMDAKIAASGKFQLPENESSRSLESLLTFVTYRSRWRLMPSEDEYHRKAQGASLTTHPFAPIGPWDLPQRVHIPARMPKPNSEHNPCQSPDISDP
jgi:hypothetical protein